MQAGLRAAGLTRYQHLRWVGEELPLWLLQDTPPAFLDTETRFMPDDAAVTEAVRRSPGLNPIRAQRLALGVLIDAVGVPSEWDEERAVSFVDAALAHDTVGSYNGLAFDNELLAAYCDEERERRLHVRTLDLMFWLQWHRGEQKPRKLNDHAWELLRKRKLDLSTLVTPAENPPAVFRRGRPEDLVALRCYGHRDTELLRDLYQVTNAGDMHARRNFYGWWLQEQVARLEREISRQRPAASSGLPATSPPAPFA